VWWLHDVGGGSGGVEREAAGQSDMLVWLAHLLFIARFITKSN